MLVERGERAAVREPTHRPGAEREPDGAATHAASQRGGRARGGRSRHREGRARAVLRGERHSVEHDQAIGVFEHRTRNVAAEQHEYQRILANSPHRVTRDVVGVDDRRVAEQCTVPLRLRACGNDRGTRAEQLLALRHEVAGDPCRELGVGRADRDGLVAAGRVHGGVHALRQCAGNLQPEVVVAGQDLEEVGEVEPPEGRLGLRYGVRASGPTGEQRLLAERVPRCQRRDAVRVAAAVDGDVDETAADEEETRTGVTLAEDRLARADPYLVHGPLDRRERLGRQLLEEANREFVSPLLTVFRHRALLTRALAAQPSFARVSECREAQMRTTVLSLGREMAPHRSAGPFLCGAER